MPEYTDNCAGDIFPTWRWSGADLPVKGAAPESGPAGGAISRQITLLTSG
jgi:hypothetical protein